MTPEEIDEQREKYYDDLLKIAAGWLYWPLEQALHTDINYILIAQEGHSDMLKAIFGSSESNASPTKPARDATGQIIKLTPNVFDIHFDRPRNLRKKF